MYKLRSKDERGTTKTNWLDSKHTFSFANYYDLANMGFSDLRVINDDIVAPGTGFGLHSHDNMEILSVVLSGTLEHSDSMGNKTAINAGDIQKMSAGTGIYHSEMNPSKTQPVHFLQIWILPDTRNLKPYYEQKTFSRTKLLNNLHLIASKDELKGSLPINQDVNVYQCILEKEKIVNYTAKASRKIWIQAALGKIQVNSQILEAGDGYAIINENDEVSIKGLDKESNFLLFDLRK